jgi:hypothetical protein
VTEEWRPVVGFEGLYEVSDYGNVRSVDHWVMRTSSRNPNSLKPFLVRGRTKSTYMHKRGYPAVSLVRENKSKTHYVHSLVAAAFLGPRLDGQEVRHLDGDARNCHIGNLAYGTSLENAADMRRHGTHHNTRKTHCRRGHAYDAENTYIDPGGGRYCNACRRSRRARKAAAA